MSDFATTALAMTDSFLFRWFAFLALVCAVMYLATRLLAFAANRRETGDQIAADALDPMTPLLSQRTAQRIRAQIQANHDAEIARFKAALDDYEGGAA